jgi:hypothetical protein
MVRKINKDDGAEDQQAADGGSEDQQAQRQISGND